MIVTIDEILDAAAEAVHLDRQEADLQFGAGLFDKAIAHHKKLKLRANILKGTTRNKRGQQSRCLDYDWAHVYDGAPHLVWSDFFRGAVMNSCSRMARGLNP